jgi:hypothetical protein
VQLHFVHGRSIGCLPDCTADPIIACIAGCGH